MEEIIERLQMYLRQTGETKNSLALLAGLSPSNFNRKMNGGLPFTHKDFVKISGATGMSAAWIETGEGDMMEPKKSKATTNNADGRPFYDLDFALGFSEYYNDLPEVPAKNISVPGYECADFWCRTSGDSMTPILSNGDIIALKEVKDWQVFLPTNEAYAVMTTNNMRTVKIVRQGHDDEHFILHAYNEEYADQEIAKASITKIFKVLGALKRL
jgi:phage repressor protein C with HTH and peptisase S24 domain